MKSVANVVMRVQQNNGPTCSQSLKKRKPLHLAIYVCEIWYLALKECHGLRVSEICGA